MKGICFSGVASAPPVGQIRIQLKEITRMQTIERKPLFDLGQLVATPGALAALEKSGQNAMAFLSRHVSGDWGDLPKEDREENQLSLAKGFRLLSSYSTSAGDRIWIITEADRSHSTVLLPDEY
jgi:hypothetical protein